MGKIGTGFTIGVVVMLLVGIAGWLAVAYSGVYNVAASDRHFDVVRWTFDTTMRRAIASRADEITLPDDFPDEVIAEGGRLYAGTCMHCHGAPGLTPAEWSRGMRPEPPHLVEAARHWSPEEVFWIVQNGIKMTGMPAFGEHHNTREITALTAFVVQLPGMSADDYRMMTGGAGGQGASQNVDAGATAPPSQPPDESARSGN